MFYASRKRWLGYAAGFGGASEMLLLRDSDQKFELVYHAF
jgi:hypothetical protein